MDKRSPRRERSQKFARHIGDKEKRKIEARKRKKFNVWFGLGMFGMIGWSVAIPTVIFTALGIWIDTMYESRFSWTLIMLVAGVIIGCLIAWNWVKRESRDE